MKKKETRTRFAPSPTGFLHIGGLRTALYAYLIAKKNNGKFILRIEDTDRAREVDREMLTSQREKIVKLGYERNKVNELVTGSTETILLDLDWAGVLPGEGIYMEEGDFMKKESSVFSEKGKKGPYIQSQRLKLYKKHLDQLLDSGNAYHCFCTPERLEQVRRAQQKNKQAPRYDEKCRGLSEKEVAEKISRNEKYVVRMKVPHNEKLEFEDEVFGKIQVDTGTIDDQVLLKSDGFPTYHLAVVVDDHLMKISHVTRGEEWLPSTPKHVLLYKFFGWEVPKFIHLPTIRSIGGKKLSKREGDVSVIDFRLKGYLPEALINFISLLGWNPKTVDEYLSLDELVEKFSISGLHKAGAVFDYKKLDWMNAHYIKQKSDKELLGLCRKYFNEYFESWNKMPADEMLQKVISIEKERMKVLSEITENIDFYFNKPSYEMELLRWKDMGNAKLKQSLGRSNDVLEKIEDDEFDLDVLQEKLFEEAGDDKGGLLWPLRVALTGQKKSPSPFEVAWVLGKKETLGRLKIAISKIS